MQVLSTTVEQPDAAVARLRIAADAPLGFRDLKVTTGAQDAALLDGFEVMPVRRRLARRRPGAAGPVPPARTARRRAPRFGGKQGVPPQASCACAAARATRAARSPAGRARRGRDLPRGGPEAVPLRRARGKLTRARSCSKPVWLKANGTTSVEPRLKRKLPRGTYTIQVARPSTRRATVQARPAKRSQRVR